MISGKGVLNLTRKACFLTALLAVLTFMPAISFAQDLPCNGDDPYGPCPLDTNVWILASIALFAGAVFLYKQQKPQHKV